MSEPTHRNRAVGAASGAVLMLVSAAVAFAGEVPRDAVDSTRSVTSSPGEVRLVCPPPPRLAATSTDRQFSAGGGVEASTLTAYSVTATGGTLSGAGAQLSTGAVLPTPTPSASSPPRRATSSPSGDGSPSAPTNSVTPGPTSTTPPGGREVPRPTANPVPESTAPNPPTALTPGTRVGDLTRLTANRVPSARILASSPRPGAAALVGGLSLARTTGGDLRGLSAGLCAEPHETSWLVGGRSGTGAGGRLVITNPAATPATVHVRLLTPNGVLTPAAGSDLVVPAGHSRELLLRALILDESVLAVGVSSDGAPVSAHVVDQLVFGTDPAGVDVVAAGPVATQHVLLGRTTSGDQAVLRIGVPGSREANVGYRIEDVDGSFGEPKAVSVPGGSVAEVTLATGPEAVTSVILEADVPVVAGMELTRRVGAARDRAWAASAQRLTGSTLIPLPPTGSGVTATLLVASGGDEASRPLTLQRYDAAGRRMPDVQVTLTTSGAVAVDAAALRGASSVVLVPTEGVSYRAAVSLASASGGDGAMLSVVTVPPPPRSSYDLGVQNAAPGVWP